MSFRQCYINITAILVVSFRRPFHFTPLQKGSPYDAAKLGFLLFAVRGAFALPSAQAYAEGNFSLKEEAKSWPLLCQSDNSSKQLKVKQSQKLVLYIKIGTAIRTTRKVWKRGHFSVYVLPSVASIIIEKTNFHATSDTAAYAIWFTSLQVSSNQLIVGSPTFLLIK